MIMQRDILILMMGLSLTTTIANRSEASSLSLDLSGFMAAHDLKATDIDQVVTLAAPVNSPWATGLIGDMKNGSITLKPQGSAAHVATSSLHVRFNTSSTSPVSSDRPMERTGSKWTITGEDGTWQLWVYDSPCENGVACFVRVPSWALAIRRAMGDGSMQTFPSVATLIDHKDGLSLVNALTGAEWLSWPRQGFEQLGKLKTATFTEAGVLVATFENGALMLDFAGDRVVLADDQGIAVGDGGIGALGFMPFDRIVSGSTGESLGAPLYVSDQLTVWRSSMVLGTLGVGLTMQPTPCNFIAVDGRSALCSEDGKIQIWRRSATFGTFAFEGEAIAPQGTTSAALIGGEPFALSAAGLYALSLATGSPQPTSLSFASPEILLAGAGAFVRNDGKSSACRVVHLEQNLVLRTSFKESGLSAPCNGLRGVAVAGRYASISVFEGHQVNVQWVGP